MRLLDEVARLLHSGRYSWKTLADGTGVVLDKAGMRVLSLNRSGMSILDAIAEGVNRREELVERLTERFEVDPVTAARDLADLLDELDRLLIAPSRP